MTIMMPIQVLVPLGSEDSTEAPELLDIFNVAVGILDRRTQVLGQIMEKTLAAEPTLQQAQGKILRDSNPLVDLPIPNFQQLFTLSALRGMEAKLRDAKSQDELVEAKKETHAQLLVNYVRPHMRSYWKSYLASPRT